MSGAIYSDAWYKIANVHVGLLPGVKATPQSYRGQAWVVLEDAYAHRFFRITPDAHDFLKTLHAGISVDEAWQAYLREHPERAPGQEEVVQLLSQLHISNLLYFQDNADSRQIDQRANETQQKELKAKALSFLYFRVPLWDPDDFLNATDRWIRHLPAVLVWALWIGVLVGGAVVALTHWEQVASSSQGAFAWANLPLLYLCMAVMKVAHELCHGFVCKRYGGKVHTFGLMFLVTTPLPYIDVTASWTFPNKWHRMLVSSAGMMADLFMAAAAALVWVATGPGLANSLAFNVMLIGSVSSLLFNGNPLLRFDAYYVLADFLDIPNFYQKAQSYWFYLGDRYLLGSHAARTPVDVPSERKWLMMYAPVSLVYRLTVSYAIVLFVMDLWFGMGLVVFGITFYMLILAPLWKAAKHLFGPRVQAHRWRAWLGAGGSVLAAFLLLFVLPLPYAIKAPGVVQFSRASVLHTPIDARLVQAQVGNGQWVQAGETLLGFDAEPLRLDLLQMEREYDELQALQRAALVQRSADVSPLQDQLDTKRERMQELHRRVESLTVRAPHEGRYVTLEGRERLGSWLNQGLELGHVLDSAGGHQFVAVISQERARELFGVDLGVRQVRLRGQANVDLEVDDLVILPYERDRLPSAALGWLGGGEVAVTTDDQRGEKAVESFFEVRATLRPATRTDLRLMHGLKGVLRIELPNRSLFQRASDSLRQLLQKRYQLG
jgi:putative peptide zinc metalloprotease protein